MRYVVKYLQKLQGGLTMPIKIPDSLPARAVLESENIFVMTEYRALHQDIRPLHVLILNLMPTKIVTEIQLMRKLANSPLQVDVDLMYTSSYSSRHTSLEHLSSFYTTFDAIKDQRYDGMIITGAPVEDLDFEQVDYWPELVEIMDWSRTHVYSTLHICWGAYAGLYHHYGIQKHNTPHKIFGVYPHQVLDSTQPLFRGFDDIFMAPHSRNTEVLESDIRACEELELLSISQDAGVFAAATPDKRQIFVCGHLEYDADTLSTEYFRDKKKGLDIAVPEHYFPSDDPTQAPLVTWRAHGQLFYSNWLNYYVYQATPYDLRDL